MGRAELDAERMDELVADALATGRIPADATTDEREEIERLLAGARQLQASRGPVHEEARAAMPVARARFERFVATNPAGKAHAHPAPVAVKRSGLLVWLFGGNALARTAAVAAAITVLAVGGVLFSQSLGGVETANALVLEEGDYAQASGVVASTSGEGASRKLELRSEFGTVVVSVGSLSGDSVDPTSLKAGDSVVVDGTVGRDRSIEASTVVRTAVSVALPQVVKFKQLRELTADLAGKVVTFTISKDGTHGVVLVDGGDGNRYIVKMDAGSAAELLEKLGTALGARVEIARETGAPRGVFVVRPATAETPVGGGALKPVTGIVASRQGNVLQLRTDRGPVTVVIRGDTRILLGRSGLTLEGFLRGETVVGHQVEVRGRIEKATGNLIADVVTVGPKPVQSAPGEPGEDDAGSAEAMLEAASQG